MGLKKVIINIILRFVNIFVNLSPIKNNQVAFVSLESNKLESDLKLIYDELSKDDRYNLKTVLINYNKNKKTVIYLRGDFCRTHIKLLKCNKNN